MEIQCYLLVPAPVVAGSICTCLGHARKGDGVEVLVVPVQGIKLAQELVELGLRAHASHHCIAADVAELQHLRVV